MEKLRYLNKGININERKNFSRWWKEQIDINGQEVDYYLNNATLSAMNPIYGEEPNTIFSDPKKNNSSFKFK